MGGGSTCLELDRTDVLKQMVSYMNNMNNSPLLENSVTKQALTKLYNTCELVLDAKGT